MIVGISEDIFLIFCKMSLLKISVILNCSLGEDLVKLSRQEINIRAKANNLTRKS